MITTDVALISLPHLTLPGGNVFNTLHGYWNPPDFVQKFWSVGCIVRFVDDDDYELKKVEVLNSQQESFNQFYKDNAL